MVSIKDMHKIYNPGENEVRALDGVSLEIHEGEFVAIIGHSGSGKSTLMNMIGIHRLREVTFCMERMFRE